MSNYDVSSSYSYGSVNNYFRNNNSFSSRFSAFTPVTPLSNTNITNAVRDSTNSFNIKDNYDPNPIIVRKKPRHTINYTQQVTVKFLQPPPLPPVSLFYSELE